MINSDFDSALQSFIDGCNKIVEAADLTIPCQIRLVGGRKYAKLAAFEERLGEWNITRVYAFVNTENGDVLKPASYKAPAKGARGNIFAEDNGLGCMSWTGPAYLR